MFSLGRYGKWIFLIASAGVVTAFLYFSNILVHDLAERERERMEIWADATKEILRQFGDQGTATTTDTEAVETIGEEAVFVDQPMEHNSPDIESSNEEPVEMIEMAEAMPVADISFLLRILEGNTTIPVLLVDENNHIINHRNFDLPEPTDASATYGTLSAVNQQYLNKKLKQLSGSENVIDIELDDGVVQHLYYEDSRLLQRLSYFPYVQLAVMVVFLLVAYFAVSSSHRAEQNKVWVGLSKETAHQLGTPISSLMAWIELLPEMGADPDTCAEMDKDVRRLSTIASRFSKIGSRPGLQVEDIGVLVQKSSSYMGSRISSRIVLTTDIPTPTPTVQASAPLFEWVMENLIKNAVDAMEGTGSINIQVTSDRNRAIITVADTGRGIPAKNRRRVFKPGFTTKSRGWGLGLTLARRIVEQYHKGHIYIKDSAPGKGTTFCIELPLANSS